MPVTETAFVVCLTRQMGCYLLLVGKELACVGAEQTLPHPRVLWPWDMACSVLRTASCMKCCAGSWAASRLEALAVYCPVSS